jgi:acyl-CoA synthetase (AMP-forming)/AMP-acid ligase II
MARPMADKLEEIQDELDLSNLFAVSSSAAIFSQSIKDQLMERLPNIAVVDSVGATETGMNGVKVATKGEKQHGGPATVEASLDTIVVDDDLNLIEPGSGKVGRIARTGNIPLGYYKDEAKTAATFPVIDGVRWAVPGDLATLEADGTVTVFGRGSVSSNTGGEKVFPEEVESALKAHPSVFDAVVVGVPDERWGERVAAVVQPRHGAGESDLDVDELAAHCRRHLAGYKVPRSLVLVDEVVRSPSGKPDYRWARARAIQA